MNELEILIESGRRLKTGHGFRGALIQLEGKIAYLTNMRRSMMFKINFDSNVGTGTFFASEAPIDSIRVERRAGKVMFEFKRDGEKEHVFVPDKSPINEMAENAIEKYFREPNISVPSSFLDKLDPRSPIVKVWIEDGDKLMISQRRGDGSVRSEKSLNLSEGFIEEDYDSTGKVSFFVRDLTDLKSTISGDLKLYLREGDPISIRAKLGKAEIMGVISNLTYEEEGLD